MVRAESNGDHFGKNLFPIPRPKDPISECGNACQRTSTSRIPLASRICRAPISAQAVESTPAVGLKPGHSARPSQDRYEVNAAIHPAQTFYRCTNPGMHVQGGMAAVILITVAWRFSRAAFSGPIQGVSL